MYVCGPTVYGDAHLGHGRAAVCFDVIHRYLKYLDYKVRYVRNITDVGHLTDENTGTGEDKILKKARLEQLEPMEVVQHYTNNYRHDVRQLNTLPPSIEPSASGHIQEQIETIEKIFDAGFAYETNGSVYFNVKKYSETENYGELSGRILDDLLANTRELEAQDEKIHPADFALWKKAAPEHIMRWQSPWGEGFPGWHLECTVMGAKYLGHQFDIHGGGMDLMFPHHECEIAQAKAANKQAPVKYWLHNNMITIGGQKMSKSAGNFIILQDLFAGNHDLLEQAYSPMTIRFFILQAHYRSPIDFSNEALKAAHKGYLKLMNGLKTIKQLDYPGEADATMPKWESQIEKAVKQCFDGLNDDFNTAIALAGLFDLLKKINTFQLNPAEAGKISRATFELLKATYTNVVEDILGLQEEPPASSEQLINTLLDVYKTAKEAKNYEQVDAIRSQLKSSGLVIRDLKTGPVWAYDEQ